MHLKTFGPAILIALAGCFIAWQFVNPAPPHTITIAAGPQGGAYLLFAERYRDILAREDITLEILETAGSVENLKLMEDTPRSVDLAFAQGGTASDATDTGLVSLASLYYEPLWVFYRGAQPLTRVPQLAGRRLAIGEAGSGTRAVALTLLQDNLLSEDHGRLVALGGRDAVSALQDGRVDAAFFVASADSPLISELLQSPGISLMSFERAQAYARLHPFLTSVTLPEGIIDLQKNIPPRDTQLLAATANLVAHADFHPALTGLLLQAAGEVHGSGSLFDAPGHFPNEQQLMFPQDKESKRYFRYGPPFLQRYLPFWTANLIDRLKVMLIPLLTLLVPLFKIMPPTYRWQVRKKIYRWYGELKAVDYDHPEALPDETVRASLATLDGIEDEVRKVHVPLSYADELYHLRLHIDMVRTRLQDSRPTG